MLAWAISAVAGTGERKVFDASGFPAAFPGSQGEDAATIVADVRSRLTPRMSVATSGHFVIAAPGSMEETIRQGQRISDMDAQFRRRYFPDLETRRILVILGEDSSGLQRLTKLLYPEVPSSEIPPSGFYHRKDRLILAISANGDGGILHGLMHALFQDDNPQAPRWFEEAMAILYESTDQDADRLTPMLDARMELIAPDEDLAYDVFAGVCDCSEVTAEQLALIRMLLVYLHEHDQLAALYGTIKQQGRYTTLLQALAAVNLDREAWKAFAERSVQAYSKSK